jgi:hypothetical protein
MFLTQLKLATAVVLCAGLMVALIGGALTSLAAQDGSRSGTPTVEEGAKLPQNQKQKEEKEPFTAWGTAGGGPAKAVIDHEKKVENDKKQPRFVPIASFPSEDRAADKRIRELLDAAKIQAASASSLGTTVTVTADKAKQARAILEKAVTDGTLSVQILDEFPIPNNLRAVRADDKLRIEEDSASIENVVVPVAAGLKRGKHCELSVYRGKERVIHSGGTYTPTHDFNRAANKIPQVGESYEVELKVYWFETDAPVQPNWKPESGAKHKVLVTRTLKLSVGPENTKSKDSETAWGKEVGGLQAGVSVRSGEKRVYDYGDVITLVVRVRNVGKEAVKFEYVRQFLDENLPSVTVDGKTVEQHRLAMLGFHVPMEVTLEPGKEIELESRLPLRYELRPPNSEGEPTTKERKIFVGTGKVSIQYDRVLGSSSSGAIKLDPALSKLGTGKLELEIKTDPPPQEQKKVDSDDEENAVRAYVEELRAAAKVSGQQIYNVAIRPMFYKSVRWAARKGEDKLVVELYRLYRGLPENANAGGTALTWAAAHNDAETVKILLDRGLDINATDDQGRTALHQAIHWGPHNVGRLLEKGAKVNVKTKSGETPLMLAAQASHPEVVTMLLDKKAEVNARDAEDRTALMYAAKAGRLANARALLGHGANVHLKDKAGRTALAQVQAPNLIFDRPGVLIKGAAQKLEEQAVRDEKELRTLLQSAGDKDK